MNNISVSIYFQKKKTFQFLFESAQNRINLYQFSCLTQTVKNHTSQGISHMSMLRFN